MSLSNQIVSVRRQRMTIIACSIGVAVLYFLSMNTSESPKKQYESNGSGKPTLFVIVLNWNGWKDSVPCLESLKKVIYPAVKIVVVDNGSTDDSVKHLRDSFPDVPVLETGKNLGFAGGNNHGIRYALEHGADYVFVLNNDTIVPEDAIGRLVEFAEQNPDAALIGPEISDASTGEFLDMPMLHRISVWSILLTKSPAQRMIRRRRIYRRLFYDGPSPRKVYAIHGSAMLFRRSTLLKIGLFDERTFIYWEEFIMAEKLRQAELTTYVLPSARVWHKGSASISKIGASRFLENMKSEKYFFDKYLELPFTSRVAINAVRFIGYMGRTLAQKDYRKNLPNFVRLLFSNGRNRGLA